MQMRRHGILYIPIMATHYFGLKSLLKNNNRCMKDYDYSLTDLGSSKFFNTYAAGG